MLTVLNGNAQNKLQKILFNGDLVSKNNSLDFLDSMTTLKKTSLVLE